MRLIKFEWSNLFCMGKGAIDLEGRGLTLVTGYSEDEGGGNGSGKSSLANKGILWTLFGETAGGLRADAAINIHGKKTCLGRLTFKRDDRDYRISRKRPAKLSLEIMNEDDWKWQDISSHTAKETQALIDSLLGFDFETFVQTSVFGQGRLAHYPSLSPKQRKEVLENILPMEEADRWANFTDDAIKGLMPKFERVASDIVQGEAKLQGIQREMHLSAEQGQQFEASRKYKIGQAEEEILNVEARFECELDGIAVTTAMLEGTDVDALTNQRELILFESGTWDKYRDDAHDKYFEADSSEVQWRSRVKTLHENAHRLSGSQSCLTCNRPFDTESAAAANETLERIAEEIKTGEAAIAEAITAHTYFFKEYKKWLLQIGNARAKAEGIEDYIKEYQGLEVCRELAQAKVDAATAAARARLDYAKNEENLFVALYERHAGEETIAQDALNSVNLANTKLIEELDHLKHWKQVYGKDLKLKLFEDACPFLDSRTAYHLSALKNSQIHCEFSTIKRLATGALKDEFDVVVWSETGGRGFEALSGGEQQMVSFAIGLSLADLASRVGGSESGFLILDEPFTELDERNAEAVIEYLTAEVKSGRDTILLISNEESLKGLIQNRIHVVKKDGISNVSND